VQQTLDSVTEAISLLSSVSSPAVVVSPTPPTAEHFHHDSETHSFDTPLSQPSNPPIPPLVQQAPTHPPSPSPWSGESIYRTIMNRLTTLEANHSLYARYVEEQTAGVREVLRKLNEEVGRLESVVSVPNLATNQYVNIIVSLHPESNAGTDVSTYGS
jgi:hypothetical protein